MTDHIAREYLLKKLAPSGVADIYIKITINTIGIDITVARPGVVIGRGGQAIELLKKHLSKIYKEGRCKNYRIKKSRNSSGYSCLYGS